MFSVIASTAKQFMVAISALDCFVILLLAMTAFFPSHPSFAQEDITVEEDAAPEETKVKPAEEKKVEKKEPAKAEEKKADKDKAEEKTEEKKPEQAQEPNAVTLLALNKVTARVAEFTAPIGVVTKFGNLEVIARACKKSAPDQQPENTALLEIWELKPKGSPDRIFNGWMFSSSPALNALENPVYDITVKECVFKSVDEL